MRLGSEEDIGAWVPRPPPPNAARRRSAIDEALRRFDGGDPEPALAPRRPTTGRTGFGRPQVAAMATLAVVALIGFPVAWESMRQHQAPVEAEQQAHLRETVQVQPAPETAAEAPRTNADAALDEAPPQPAMAAPAGRSASSQASSDRSEPQPARTQQKAASSPARVAAASAPPEAVAAAAPAARRNELEDTAAIVMTGIRASLAPSMPRGDWNACTVDDPSRDLSACRDLLESAARHSKRKRGTSRVADGLSLAWSGKSEAAIETFGRALKTEPHSSAAYLNRGLLYARTGDLDRAIDDLDKAVRYAPKSARAYYNRSLLLRRNGEEEKARSDAARAIALDPAYGEVLKPEE